MLQIHHTLYVIMIKEYANGYKQENPEQFTNGKYSTTMA